MKRILVLTILLCSQFANAQTRNTYTRIPISQEIISPDRGAEIWHNEFAGNIVNTISETVYQSPLDIYQRSPFTWDLLEPTQGNYDFSSFDALFRWAIPLRKKVGFCIISQWPDRNPSENPGQFYDGFSSSYPEYLHDLMQAEGGNNTDYVRANTWIPNYNSPNYLARVEALLNALANHINNTTFQGVRYADALGYVDIGLYGSWGEWNQVFVHNTPSDYPPGRQPTVTSLNRIIDAHSTAFPNHQIIFNISALDGQQLENVWVPDAVGYHALTSQNNFGKFGICKKSWGWPTSWFTSIWLDENPNVFNGMRFDTAAGNRWRYAPINGEGPGGGTAISDPENNLFNDVFMGLLPNQVRRFRISQLGNGNFGGEHLTSVRGRDSLRLAWRLMGYRIFLDSTITTTSPVSGGSFNIRIHLNNEGVAPVYHPWKYVYELRNSSTGAVVWRDTSNINMRLVMGAFSANENFTLGSIPAGTYRLHLKIVERSGYRDPFPLSIQGRQSDGSYILRNNISITSTGNLPPVANAGLDQSITLPTNSVTLNGSGTDADGTIVNYQWIRVLGTGGTIVSPTSPSTQVSGLSAGSHTFRLIVTDNQGATATDDVVITVNSTAPANNPPTSNAGANVVIQLPTSSVTLNGSGTDTDGTISAYAWTKVSGPAGGTIASPSAASTNITGLNAGVYVYRLTVTDNLGATGADDVQITVTAANVAPTANAGADRVVTLPTTTVSLTGSGTDTDGSITAFLWTRVSGPAGGNISSPTSATTNITGLQQGIYVFRLRVTDNQGAVATDDVQVTVNPEPQPQAPGNWVFTVNPTTNQQDDGQGVTLGMKFRSSQAGAITQIRFWKTPQSGGLHVAAIYNSAGVELIRDTFTNETASGWQIQTLNDTLYIDANTTYIVAYHAPNGFYNATGGYFNTSAVNNFLTAPSSATSGGNGVYIYGSSLAFPNQTFNATNYWIDVNFQQVTPPTTPNIGPVVSAGFDAVVLAPNTQYQLNGTATDADGDIDSVRWYLQSVDITTGNPVTVVISDSAILNPVVSGLSEPGTYRLILQAWDDSGASSTDLIEITVRTATINYLRKRVYIFNGRSIRFR